MFGGYIKVKNFIPRLPHYFDHCVKTVVFAARRREGVVVAPVCITNNMTVCYVSVN
jgi:hypothetical protein